MKHLRLLCILSVMFCGIANAATIHATGVPVSACAPALAIINKLDYPGDWKVMVVGEKLWKDGHFASELAVTDRAKHVTLIRAQAFTDLHFTGRYITPRHVLAHELGHIVCDCNDEWKAEQYAATYDRD
jgi:hypothetical protein